MQVVIHQRLEIRVHPTQSHHAAAALTGYGVQVQVWVQVPLSGTKPWNVKEPGAK